MAAIRETLVTAIPHNSLTKTVRGTATTVQLLPFLLTYLKITYSI